MIAFEHSSEAYEITSDMFSELVNGKSLIYKDPNKTGYSLDKYQWAVLLPLDKFHQMKMSSPNLLLEKFEILKTFKKIGMVVLIER